ncbi:uncharacterized protein LOC121724970 [Alosa sapidissima]|uniref:uncharacterized protein LOC121724970 n=1 Tax=Alosa sapidissima TaxID=34773 RepID=UPI001C084048|nr:uncharacterized protein LOC121724970 [Alosa sapidissima]
MEQGNKGRATSAPYSLRRQVVPSRRFEDFYLERQPLSKKKDLQTGEKLTWKTVEGSASSSSQSPLPMPIVSGEILSCGDNSSALPLHYPGSSLPAKDGCESPCKVSGLTLSTAPEASERVGRRKKQAKPCQVVPCKDQAEQGLGISNGPLVIKLCTPEQKTGASLASVCKSSSKSHREPQLSSQALMGSTPQAPMLKKAPQKKVAPQGNYQKSNDLKQRLEIAAILLELAQQVPDLVPEVGCTINFQQQLQLIKKCSSKGNQKGTSVKARAHKEVTCDHNGYCKKYHSTEKHGQKRKYLSSLDSGPVMGPEWTAARDREDMFFPHLDDSSLMAEAKERKRREMAQESSLQQMAEPVEERYIKNAAVLPDLRPLPPVAPSSAQSSSLLCAALSEPLLIHGHSVEDYQAIYHAVVDPMLKTKSGNARQYNLGMGRAIKQRLWERMSCPTFVETVDVDGRVHITESFSTPTLKSYAPQIDVDISGEPLPGQPKSKRARR